MIASDRETLAMVTAAAMFWSGVGVGYRLASAGRRQILSGTFPGSFRAEMHDDWKIKSLRVINQPQDATEPGYLMLVCALPPPTCCYGRRGFRADGRCTAASGLLGAPLCCTSAQRSQ
jgi:hypothetical protein